jgi:hypothetical protein
MTDGCEVYSNEVEPATWLQDKMHDACYYGTAFYLMRD